MASYSKHPVLIRNDKAIEPDTPSDNGRDHKSLGLDRNTASVGQN